MIDTSRFYVISIVTNPIRYQRRWDLMKQFQRHMHDVGAKLITVEVAYGKREYQVTERDNPMHLQFRSQEELWHKENVINLAINYLCQLDPQWEYVAWVDSDIHFQRHDIIAETAHQLQHYDIVQMFSHAIDMGPQLQPFKIHNGFMWSYHQNNFCPPRGAGNGGYYGAQQGAFWHPGFAWAARREALDKIQLLDKAILGAGDHHMALCLIGEGKRSLPGGITQGYKDMVLEWEQMAVTRLRKNVGYVDGSIIHYWHGSKKNRQYVDRWQILIDNKYDPNKDLSRDPQGMYRLNIHHGDRSIKIRDLIRGYFRQRNEDCIYFDPAEQI
jgi:hypothetical protein